MQCGLRVENSWYRGPCDAWPCVVRGRGWWAAAGGGWTWACGLCSSPRGAAQMTDKPCQGASGEGGGRTEGWRRWEGRGHRCQAVRGGRELWVAMGDPECL